MSRIVCRGVWENNNKKKKKELANDQRDGRCTVCDRIIKVVPGV